ncbi:hypothetical protein PLICRDRAFT_46820 [Plicaturopsis crispa FD-325 SS-3]|uniref:Unplaced genomic scaffold PLICRscaffold_20, whole genome shotgun sequence n=1 Tax=Plicaturopsis crispa FD-325 SS-3 TaxID=944288 RepID=A0A0C9T3V4_PLICR|nr:hypothetical protein PLICRDRAFT_46820 [Plicaturopsis crispa FD-325 SS-3]
MPRDIASSWLSKFAPALCSGDIEATVSTFAPDGWLRDVLALTWDTRSLEGRAKISAYLSAHLAGARIADIRLDERQHLAPEYFPLASDGARRGVAFAFTFDAAVFHGQGYVHLVQEEASGEWKAMAVLLMNRDIKGHEEAGPESGVYGDHTLSWEEVRAERRKKVEADPHVLILGGGQTGLHIAARFKQMNIPAIVVERNHRIGDNWRQRYPTLTLHTTRSHHTFLYQPYPTTWPKYTPRDKVADWLEQYVESQDLVVWTDSTLLPPRYNPKTRRWTAVVRKNDTNILLHPAHIVIAVGTLGAPRIPPVRSLETFAGTVMHASSYAGGHPFVGKRAVVIGAGNTAADICQDLVFRGAASVTMVQRTSTCVMTAKWVRDGMAVHFPEGVDTEVSDFKVASMPLGLLKILGKREEAASWAREKDMYDGLRKAGLKLNMGVDGTGQHLLIYERFGVFWIDVGIASLIISGNVKVKQGVEPTQCTANTVVFSDGSELDADLVVFATGYHSSRESLKDLFGSEVIEQTNEMWGLDEESEVRGSYRRSGHPGLWYGAGDFSVSRSLSKQLALQIKAIELGLMAV